LPRRNHLVAHPSIALPGPDPHYELHREDNCHVLDSLGASRNFRHLSAAEVHSMANILGLRFLHTHLSIGCERYNQTCDSEQGPRSSSRGVAALFWGTGAPPLFPSTRLCLRNRTSSAIQHHKRARGSLPIFTRTQSTVVQALTYEHVLQDLRCRRLRAHCTLRDIKICFSRN
jgi:hypothetical protein